VTSERAAVAIGPLDDNDRARWELLARGYKAFYETELADVEYERAWRRLVAGDAVHALGALRQGRAPHRHDPLRPRARAGIGQLRRGMRRNCRIAPGEDAAPA